MMETVNAMCRCCHEEGEFKSLQLAYSYKQQDEVYATMLKNTFGIMLKFPLSGGMDAICDECIVELRAAARFNQQVQACEANFQHNLNNICLDNIKVEHDPEVKSEASGYSTMHDDHIYSSGYFNANENTIQSKVKSEATIATQTEISYIPATHKVNKTNGSIIFNCKLCGEGFKTRGYLKKHTNTHFKDTKYTCEECSKDIIGFVQYRRHMDQHRYQGKFICNYCNVSYKYKSTLRVHILGHLGMKDVFICDICGHKCNNKTNLKIHIMGVHRKIKPYACDICGKQYAKKATMREHRLRHEGITPESKNKYKKPDDSKEYTCSTCQKVYWNKRNYKNHLRTHGPKKHICMHCGRGFDRGYCYKRHLATHADERKRFHCSKCNVTLSTMGSLKKHERNVHNLNPIPKTRCQLCCSHVSDMEKHMLVHKVRPFTCDICAKSYPFRNALNRHLKEHFEEPKFPCNLCAKAYRRRDQLAHHQMKAHGLKLENESKYKDNDGSSVKIEVSNDQMKTQ